MSGEENKGRPNVWLGAMTFGQQLASDDEAREVSLSLSSCFFFLVFFSLINCCAVVVDVVFVVGSGDGALCATARRAGWR